MDLFDAINTRTCVRKYQDRSVPKDVLEKLVDAGRRAPSAHNKQPWEFVIITNDETKSNIAALTDYGQFIQNAPACIVVFCEDTKYYLEDGCATVENILLAATGLGLGACWVAGDKKGYAQNVNIMLKVPDRYKLIALIPVGYRLDRQGAKNKRPLEQVIHWEKF
ncbi:nitroreductase family protein [candidate division KSB1 bacterium]|nr:nitroreductase family protein [candidate division KSB1 bacterium]